VAASRSGWQIVAACGAVVLILGVATTGRWARGTAARTAALLEPSAGNPAQSDAGHSGRQGKSTLTVVLRLLAGCRSGAAGCVLCALVTPVLAEFAVMKSAQQMRVMIQPVGGSQHLVKVVAVIARCGFLFRPLADDAQLLPAQLGDLVQYLF